MSAQIWSVAARAAPGLPNGVDALARALAREANPRVREAIFTSLACIGSVESIEAVLPLLGSAARSCCRCR